MYKTSHCATKPLHNAKAPQYNYKLAPFTYALGEGGVLKGNRVLANSVSLSACKQAESAHFIARPFHFRRFFYFQILRICLVDGNLLSDYAQHYVKEGAYGGTMVGSPVNRIRVSG